MQTIATALELLSKNDDGSRPAGAPGGPVMSG